MNPTHLPKVSPRREALAPYNFVPLPEQVVRAEDNFADVRDTQDRYYAGRFTGRIACTLTSESPLFVRCGLTPAQLAAGLEAKELADFFFTESPDTPVIPGSSLRGMLRSLVEIAAYAKIERVTDRPRYFYRAVAAKADDPLANPYRSQLRGVKAGYLTRSGAGWAIIPARPIGSDSFIKVREGDIPSSIDLVRLNAADYHLQQIAVSFTHTRTPRGRTVVDRIDRPGVHKLAGQLVTSGNMIETGRGRTASPRKNHIVVPEPGGGELRIDPQALDDYRNGLSDFVAEELGPAGVLAAGSVVFYLDPGQGEVTAFGHSPNFRLPYRYPGSERAASPRDFVPAELRADDVTDLAEAIFGYVRGSRQGRQGPQALAGRIFVGDATPAAGQADYWLSDAPITPQVLGGPKPTTFQHYLVQPDEAQRELKHYASKPGEETAIRGHKLYWHKGADPQIAMPPTQVQTTNASQLTSIRPVRAGVRFDFTLHVENLSEVELGALLWVLRLGGDPAYRLKLGMGKPLGMGAVRLEHTFHQSCRTAEDRQHKTRYTHLFAGAEWAVAEDTLRDEAQDAAVAAFEDYVLAQSGERAKGYAALGKTLRMRCLLALLSWPGPLPERTRYQEIERGARKVNEYKDRPVLPLPTQVVGDELSAAELAAAGQSGQPKPTPEAAKPARAEPHIPGAGAVFTGKVSEIDPSMAVIAVPGFSAEQAVALLSADVADLRRYRVGNTARVEVVEVKTQRSGRKLLVVRPAARQQGNQ